MYPSVARTTTSAFTRPPGVSTRRGEISPHPGLLVDRHAAPLGGVGEAAGEARRMDPRAVRREDRAAARPATSSRVGRGGRLEPGARPSSPKPQARSCSTRACRRGTWIGAVASSSVPPLWKWASIPSAAATAPTSSTVREQRPLQRDRGVATVPLRGGLAAPGEQRRAPPAVATRRAEAGDLGLEHRDPQRRVAPGELVRGPQPGVARPRRPPRRRRGRGRAPAAG